MTLPMVFLVLAAIAVQALPRVVARRRGVDRRARRRPKAAFGTLIVIADAAVGQQGVALFIYFQF